MERIEEMAELSIRRGLSFVLLAVSTLMVGLSATPDLSFQSGGCLLGLCSAAMAYRALSAGNFPYQRTEIWLLMKDASALPPDRLQRAIAEIRRRLYARYAKWTGIAAAGLWLTGAFAAVLV